MSGPVTSVARVEDVQIFLKDPVYAHTVTWYAVSTFQYFDMIQLTSIGLTAGGSSTVHIYTQTIHRTTQWTQTIHITALTVPRLCEL